MAIPRRSCLAILLGIIVSARSEKCGSALDGHLLVAEEGTIWKLRPEDGRREAYAPAASAVKLAYGHARAALYYSEMTTRQVLELDDGPAGPAAARAIVGPRHRQQAEQWLPRGLAVDERSDKLYVLEGFAGALHARDLASGRSSLVIGANLTEPKDVEIDADEGYLFVLDKYRILRAELDGSNPRPIYEEQASIGELLEEYPPELVEAAIESVRSAPDRNKRYRRPLSVADLALDARARRLYWLDTQKRSIESCDYEGRQRRGHFRDAGLEGSFESLASLAFADGALYWADDVARKLFRVDEAGSRVLASDIESHALAAPSCGQRPTRLDDPCADSPCRHLCLLSRSSRTGYRCACDVGFELARDGKTCGAVEDFILFTQENYLRGKSSSESHKDVIDPSAFPSGRGAHIDVDINSGVVYYSSLFPHDKLHAVEPKSGRATILSPDLLSNSTGDLAYDWTTGNLYYLTYYYADATTLSVSRVDEPSYSKILLKNVPRLVRGLVVHPHRGYVFLARLDDERDQSRRGTISRLATDGSGLRTILDQGRVNSVDALALDYDEDRIYWSETADSGNGMVRHANLDGGDARELPLPKDLGGVTELAIGGEHVYGLSNDQLLFRVAKGGGRAEVLVSGQQPGSLAGLKLASRALQRPLMPEHPCGSRGCRKFCFAVPDESGGPLRARCGCPYGEKLAADGISCVDNSGQEPAFLPCEHASFKCNMQTARPRQAN